MLIKIKLDLRWIQFLEALVVLIWRITKSSSSWQRRQIPYTPWASSWQGVGGGGGAVFLEGNRVFSPHHLDPFEVGRFWSRESSSSWILIAQLCIYWCYFGEGNSIATAVSSRHFLRKFLRYIYLKSNRSRKISKVQEFHSTRFLAGSQDFTPENIPSFQNYSFPFIRWTKNWWLWVAK